MGSTIYLQRIPGNSHAPGRSRREPDQYSFAVEPAAAMDITRQLLRAFFDQYVRGASGAMDLLTDMERVRLETFAKP